MSYSENSLAHVAKTSESQSKSNNESRRPGCGMEIWWEVNGGGRRGGNSKGGEIVCLECITLLHGIESIIQL